MLRRNPTRLGAATKRQQAFTLLELLIVLAILGIILGLSVVTGQRILRGQAERAAVHSFRQAVARGATLANATSTNVVLLKRGNEIVLRDITNNEDKQSYPLARSVQTNLPDAPFIQFAPTGKATPQSLGDLGTVTFTTETKTYDMTVSLIGEVKVETR